MKFVYDLFLLKSFQWIESSSISWNEREKKDLMRNILQIELYPEVNDPQRNSHDNRPYIFSVSYNNTYTL